MVWFYVFWFVSGVGFVVSGVSDFICRLCFWDFFGCGKVFV